MNIPDGDHILTDGAAWIESGAFSVRINHTKVGLMIKVFFKGEEMDDCIASCFAKNPEEKE